MFRASTHHFKQPPPSCSHIHICVKPCRLARGSLRVFFVCFYINIVDRIRENFFLFYIKSYAAACVCVCAGGGGGVVVVVVVVVFDTDQEKSSRKYGDERLSELTKLDTYCTKTESVELLGLGNKKILAEPFIKEDIAILYQNQLYRIKFQL